MVTNAPITPLIMLNLYLDDGDRHLAGKTITYHETPFSARVISWGTIDKSIPYPSGLVQTSDAQVEIADTDGAVRDWFDAYTPLRRLGEIIFAFESDADDSTNLDLPRPGEDQETQEIPSWQPIFTGEIYDVSFSPGKALITMASIVTAWLGRKLPLLGTRDNFPKMPDDVESFFIPIIFGSVQSYSSTGVEKQGVIRCQCIDKIFVRYVVARHTCHEITALYRKRKLDHYFSVVDPEEYGVIVHNVVISGRTYSMTYIEFMARQEDGTVIQADVIGINFKWYLDNGSGQVSSQLRNPVVALQNLIYYTLQDEIRTERFDTDSFAQTEDRCDTRGYVCDGAITEECTSGVAVSRICSDFIIDFYQTSHGKIAVHLYDAELDAESVIPLNTDITLRETLKSDLPSKTFNRFKYRYFRQNAPLTEWTAGSKTANWGEEQTIDYVKDQSELAVIGANPLLETAIDLYFVRDDNVAYNVIKRRIPYHTLRSYLVDFKMPAPPFMMGSTLDLSTPISLTHFGGIPGSTGFVDSVFKIYGLNYELRYLELYVKGVALPYVSDADLISSWTGTHPASTVQGRKPQLATMLNGSPTGLAPQVDFNDDYPAPPTSVTVTDGGASLGFAPTTPIPDGTVVPFINVKWQEDQTTDPRFASGYVPNLAPAISALVLSLGLRLVVGTLYPDEKPDDLTEDDINLVAFYSTDFDHLFLYVGGEDVWRAMLWDGDMVSFFRSSPTTNGYAYCDGSTGVRRSLPDGSTELITVPNMLGGTYPKGASSYSGPTSTAPVAPTTTSAGAHTHPGSTVSVGAHTHTVSGNTATDGTHIHSTSDIGHSHGLSGGSYIGGTTGGGGDHSHTGSTNSGVPDGAHGHTGSAGPLDPDGYAIPGSEHHHPITGATASGGDHSHSLTATTSVSGDTTGPSDSIEAQAYFEGTAVNVASDVHTHGWSDSGSVSGSADSGGSHTHNFATGQQTANSDPQVIPQGAIAVDVLSTDSAHTHGISASGTHTHSVSGGSLSGSTNSANISSSLSVLTTSSEHSHSISFTSGSATPSGSVSISSDGAHTHPISTTGEPKSMGLLPYLRL